MGNRQSTKSNCYRLYAGNAIDAEDKDTRERLLRYCLRAPLSLERLSIAPDGNVIYQVKATALACPCGGRLKFVELITELPTAREVLQSMGLPTDLPPIARARSPDFYQESFPSDWD